MTNPRYPMRVNVGFLVSANIGYHRDFEIYQPRLSEEDGASLEEVEGRVRISRTPQGLLVEGNFQAHTRLECVRCLEMFEQPLRWEFTELYAFSPANMTDSGLLVPEDAQLDLEPLVRDGGWLEIPISPICQPGCKGLCLECGQNLNVADCGHREPEDE